VWALVYHWLRDKRNGRWILVLDNVDDPDFLLETPDVSEGEGSNVSALRNRMAYLPSCAHGSTLITSRSRAATARLTDECDMITISPIAEATALALLEKKLGNSGAMEDMQKLAAALDHMPLALAQAAAYIKQRGSRWSVGQYLAKLEKSEKSQTRLLTSASKDLRRDEEAHNSIILTWQISFDHIRATRPSAADLLSVMSMYDHQGIPEYLLRTGASATRAGTRSTSGPGIVEHDSNANPSASDDKDSEEDDFEDDILTLENFHFISTMFSNKAFEMHRLVQLAARVWLRSHELYQEWARKGVERLDEALPNGEHENWGRCGELYPHVQSIINLQLEDRETCLRRASVQYKAAWFDWRRGLWSKAEALVAKSYSTRKDMLGPEDENTLSALSLYASVMGDQGNYEAAEKYYRRALEEKEKMLGREHPDALTNMNGLARVLRAQGHYKVAEGYHRRALEGSEKVLGREHPDTLTSVNDLARVLQAQGEYQPAGELHRQALEGREKVLGKEHPDTLASVDNLAEVLRVEGDYKAAEQLHRRALEGRKKVLGKEHPDTLLGVNNLALVLRDQGDYKAAEEHIRWALQGWEKVLGKEHPDTLLSVNNLATVLQARGDYKGAEELLRRALEGRETVLGKEHPDTLTSVWCLADFTDRLRRTPEAIFLYERAVKGFGAALGSNHPNTVKCEQTLRRLKQGDRETRKN